jgi:hypothetical protein
MTWDFIKKIARFLNVSAKIYKENIVKYLSITSRSCDGLSICPKIKSVADISHVWKVSEIDKLIDLWKDVLGKVGAAQTTRISTL